MVGGLFDAGRAWILMHGPRAVQPNDVFSDQWPSQQMQRHVRSRSRWHRRQEGEEAGRGLASSGGCVSVRRRSAVIVLPATYCGVEVIRAAVNMYVLAAFSRFVLTSLQYSTFSHFLSVPLAHL